jgi:hypothetical protein
MGIFSIFTKKKVNDPAMVATLPVVDNLNSDVTDVMQQSYDELKDEKPLKISYATGWPIDVIYGYLHKNYEEKGFNDAMLRYDLTFRDMNMEIIRNKILMVFREINLNYDVMGSDYRSRIETCSAVGLLTEVSELEKKMTIIKTHKEELKQLEADFRNDSNEASIPLKSYECGFLRGIATIAMSGTIKSTTMPEMATNYSESRASA